MILGAVTSKPRQVEITVAGLLAPEPLVVACNFWHLDSERILTLYAKSTAAPRLIPVGVYYGVTLVTEMEQA